VGSEGKESGFTLIELLVAFTIATILLAVLLRGFSDGFGGSARSLVRNEAAIIAESALDTMGVAVPLVDGEQQDRQEGRFRVLTSVRRYDEVPVSNQLYVPYELTVTVSWLEGRRKQSLALRTLRIWAVP
jgi:general secretion pathway protein I